MRTGIRCHTPNNQPHTTIQTPSSPPLHPPKPPPQPPSSSYPSLLPCRPPVHATTSTTDDNCNDIPEQHGNHASPNVANWHSARRSGCRPACPGCHCLRYVAAAPARHHSPRSSLARPVPALAARALRCLAAMRRRGLKSHRDPSRTTLLPHPPAPPPSPRQPKLREASRAPALSAARSLIRPASTRGWCRSRPPAGSTSAALLSSPTLGFWCVSDCVSPPWRHASAATPAQNRDEAIH